MNDDRANKINGFTRRAMVGTGAIAAAGIISSNRAATAQDVKPSRIQASSLDGSSFDGTDFGSVFDQVVAKGGGTIRVPAGTFPIKRTLNATLNNCISIIGDGMYATRLVFDAGDNADGFQIAGEFVGQLDQFASIEIQDLAILKKGRGGSGIRLSCPSTQTFAYPHFRVDNVYFVGVNFSADHWGAGITLNRAVHGTITRCRFVGFNGEVEGRMLYGINGEGYIGEIYISECFFESMTWAIRNHSGEGVTIDNCHMVNVLVGVLSESGPMLIVGNCHINAHEGGVKALNGNSTFVRHNLFYHREGSTRFCNMVEIIQPAEAVVDGNIFVDASNSRMNAIVVTCNTGVITANLLSPSGRDRVDSGLWIKAGSAALRAFGNQFFKKITVDPGVDTATRAAIVD